MFHDVPKCIPFRTHLDLGKERLRIVSTAIRLHLRTLGWIETKRPTRTDRKARAAPSIEAIEAMRKPGHIPYVNPIRDIEPANPNRGGCDARTSRYQLNGPPFCTWWWSTYRRVKYTGTTRQHPFAVYAVQNR